MRRLTLICQLLLLAVCLSWLLLHAWSGFDVTDEGYYLLSATEPSEYGASLTRFGHYTGGLFWLSGGDVGRFRAAGVLVLGAAACIFALGVLAGLRRQELTRGESLSIGSAVIAGALLYYGHGLPTPSYNWLSACCLLVGVGFSLLAAVAPTRRRALALVVGAGVACAVCILAKFPTGFGLVGVLVGSRLIHSYHSLSRTQQLSSLGMGLVGGLIFHFVFFEGPGVLLEGFRVGGETLSALNTGHSVSHRLSRSAEQTVELLLSSSVVGLALTVWVLAILWLRDRRESSTPIVWMLGCGTIAWGVWLGGAQFADALLGGAHPATEASVVFYALALPLAVGALVFGRSWRSPITVMVATSLLLPIVYALGSNASIDRRAAAVVGFPAAVVVVGACILGRRIERRWPLDTAVFVILLVSLFRLLTAGDDPYRRLAPLSQQTIATSLGCDVDNQLMLDPPTHEFVEEVLTAARNCGLEPQSDVLDLTGASPGVVYALCGRSPQAAWFLGGYPGSERVATMHLSRVPPERLRSVWLLTTPSQRRRIDPAPVLGSRGLRFPEDYAQCGGAVWPVRGELIQLWAPVLR